MKVVSVVGARPNFVKAAPVGRALREAGHTEVLVHTGQHYDDEMSALFFRELEIPEPKYNLAVGSGSHGWQTGQMLIRLEEALVVEKPDWVLVYGDTNSTLAAALAAVKLHIRLAHVEAGWRSYNRDMPEEHNRVLTDHCSDLLFCPTQQALENLAHEGITQGAYVVGDPMYDSVLQFIEVARRRSTILSDLSLTPKGYLLATIHRPHNTDSAENLRAILAALEEVGEPVVFPVHPRTKNRIAELDRSGALTLSFSHVRMVRPVGYLDMLVLEENARLIVTDSGGVQREAYFFAVPCLTLRSETELVETVQTGWNVLVGTAPCRITEAATRATAMPGRPPPLFGDGHAAPAIVRLLESSNSHGLEAI